MTMQMTLQTITPEAARELLKRNIRNRPLDERRAKALAKAIQRGEWVVNGDTIRISNTGVILDGQHRLRAIDLAGVTVQSFVVEGLPDSVFDSIDVGGAARTTGHVLSIMGAKHYNNLAALSRIYFVWQKTGNPFGGHQDNLPTTAQQIEIIESEGLAEICNEAENFAWCKKYSTPTITAFCFCVFVKSDPIMARRFFASLNSGLDLREGSPVALLRERMIASKADKQESISKSYLTALIFKGYKHFRDDAYVKTLRVRLDGTNPEKDIFVI